VKSASRGLGSDCSKPYGAFGQWVPAAMLFKQFSDGFFPGLLCRTSLRSRVLASLLVLSASRKVFPIEPLTKALLKLLE
jgi:hypothetical protein